VIGYDPINHNFSKEQCENIVSYISTKFFRYLVSLKKRTQNGPRHVYQFVPIQDFSKPWNDDKLYKKYKLTTDEIAFIEKMIRPMVLRHE
jgi:site-specific DNA-methyltransferase (adenine-specific)